MELDYLREFVTLARTCQFLETAEQLFISQSSLSKHIKAIEKELGSELLNRTTRRVELSEFGRAFLPYATQIARIQEEYTAELLSNAGKKKKVSICIIPLVTFYKMKDFFSFFSEKYPEYNVEFVEHGEHTLREMLRCGECDLIIVCDDPHVDDSEFAEQTYTRDLLVAVVDEEHPLAGHETLTAADIAHYPLIQLGKVNLARFLSGELPSASYTVSRGPTMMDMVNRGMGIGILTYYASRYFHVPGIKSVPFQPRTEIRLKMLYIKKKKPSAAIQAILDYIRCG